LFAPAAFVAAEEAAESVSGALLLRTDVGQAVAAGTSSGSSSSSQPEVNRSSSSSSSSSDAGGAVVTAADQQQAALAALLGDALQDNGEQRDLQQQEAAADQLDDSDSDSDDDELDPLVLEYRLFKVTEECVGSATSRIAYGLTLSKELGRIMLANVSFVVTGGNLAATWAASLVLNGLLLGYAGLAAAGQQQQSVAGSRSSSK
jgi:hypothetical protein